MPTFKKVELVEARQFTGGRQNGSDLVFWIQSNKGRAFWVDATTPKWTERVTLCYSYTQWRNVYVGDWFVLNPDGSFASLRPQDFEAAGYEPA